MAIMGDKMNGLHFKPSLGDCENKKFGYYELGVIVEKLDGVWAMVKSLKQQQKERSDWLEKLPKALVEKAFRGGL